MMKQNRLIAKVKLDHYRYPRSGVESGKYAIVFFRVLKIIEGQLPAGFSLDTETSLPLICAVGCMPKIDNVSEYIFTGTEVEDKKWGSQFEVESVRLDYDMSQERDQRKFFSYFLTDTQVDNMFAAVKNPVELLDSKNIGELIKIKGIGATTAARMCAKYEECKDNGRAYIALKELNLTKHAIDKLIEKYGSADIVVDKVTTNPYVLIREVPGYGWKKADMIAQKQGFTTDCRERVIAFAEYYLYSQADVNGNSWVSIEDLLTNVSNECAPVTKDNLTTWLKEEMSGHEEFEQYFQKQLELNNPGPHPLFYYYKPDRRVGLFSLRLLERNIAYHLERLQEGENNCPYDPKVVEGIIEEVEKEQGYTYTSEQRSGILSMIQNNVAILTGSAGSGKTSALAAVTRIFKHYNLRVDQCALSGRASSLLNEVTKVEGKTIHRLLSYVPDYEKFAFNEHNPLKSDVVVLDESSMVGGELFLSLISAIKTGAKLIMLGDTHQLEAIGLANILKDCLSSGYIASTVLTKIHRQAARSGIISQSLQVSNGHSIVKNDFSGEEIRGELQDFKIVASFDAGLVQRNIIKEFTKLYKDKKIPIEDIQVIVPMRIKGNISCKILNDEIQGIVNPRGAKDFTFEYVDGGQKILTHFRPKDRVMITRNNYHATGIDGEEKQIFNGNVGSIVDISDEMMIVNIRDVGEIILPRESWNSVMLGYAITVHKKQGDSVPYAILGFDNSCYALFSKELLYTAITRASKYCILVTQPKALNAAVKISRVKLKQTWLKDDLIKIMAEKKIENI